MRFQRSSGVLLHVSSLPSYGGIGDLGPAAHEFVAFLAAAKQHVWQVLPLCPTGYGNSPYAGSSAFAGNPLSHQPRIPLRLGLDRRRAHLLAWPDAAATSISTRSRAASSRCSLRRRATSSTARRTTPIWPDQWAEFEEFCRAEASWLDRLRPLCRTAPPIQHRRVDRVARAAAPPPAGCAGPGSRDSTAARLAQEQVLQFAFSLQWNQSSRGCRRAAESASSATWPSSSTWIRPTSGFTPISSSWTRT